MPKTLTNRHAPSWAVYVLKGTPAKLVGIVYAAAARQAAIQRAIDEFEVPPNQHGRLVAQRRD